MTYITKEECKDRFLYRIRSRNLAFGVYRAATGGFTGLRTKFDSVYAFEEYHWDNGPPFGTVKPLEMLEELPSEIVLDTDLGSACYNCGKLCTYVNFPDGPQLKTYSNGEVINSRGEWRHTDHSECTKVMPINVSNEALEKWLHEMESKYGGSYVFGISSFIFH